MPESASSLPSKRLLLIGWDSADWKIIHPLIDKGELPAIRSLVESGVSGNLGTLEPQLSPMLWTSIATGKMAYHHGVVGFTEIDPVTGNVVPVSAATRKCRTVWEILGLRGLRSHVVGWFATQSERDLEGCMVSNMFPHLTDPISGKNSTDFAPPPPGTYWPESLAADLNELRISPNEINPDEILRLFVPCAPQVDQTRDEKLALLAQRLAEAYSIHAAATWLLAERPQWDFMTIYFRAIDEISHIFMPFHPPRMEGVTERDFEIYQHVVSIAYRAHDLMLQRLLDMTGPETAVMVVSDHGFHSDHLRPRFTPNVPAGITVWHRQQGIFMVSGPGFRKDSLIHGARLLDITPTILHWFGLPVGADMEGRVLEEVFSEPREVSTIPTWESDRLPHKSSFSSSDSRALLDQFVKLGYIDAISADPTLAASETAHENSWNLARACLYGGRFLDALPLLEDCHFGFPERSDHAQLLARCQLSLGLLDEAEITARTALATAGHRGAARLIQAYIALEKSETQDALQLLEQVREEETDAPLLLHYLSLAYLALRKWSEAEATSRKMLATDPASVQGHLGLARCFIHQGRATDAVESALDGISHDYANSNGHFLLGSALFQLQDWNHSETALRRAIALGGRFDPAAAHRMLASIARFHGDSQTSEHHQLLSRYSRPAATGNLADLRRHISLRFQQRVAARDQLRRTYQPLTTPLDLLIVSGLPRSGTSLMMQLLESAGIAPMTDGIRMADDDNPRGYYEWESVKSLASDPRIIERAVGKATKVISALLPHLPSQHRYQVIFMTRPICQIAISQHKMLCNLGEETADLAEIESQLSLHEAKILSRLRVLPNVKLLEISFPDLVSNPDHSLSQLAEFLSERFSADHETAAIIHPALFRNRGVSV